MFTYIQPHVAVEHSCATTDNASALLTAVMGLKTVLMAVMKSTAVSVPVHVYANLGEYMLYNGLTLRKVIVIPFCICKV